MARSGSNKRQRHVVLSIRFDPEEARLVRSKAAQAGTSVAEVLRAALFGFALPHRAAPVPSIDRQAVVQLRVALARTTDALRGSLAELGKVNSNVNQIAHSLNAGRPPERVMGIIETTLQEHRAAMERHDDIMRDLLEIRLPCLQALGAEPERDHPADPTTHPDSQPPPS